MGALPGQRAAQRPMRAATAAQRVLGRAASAAGGMASRLVLDVAGRRWEVRLGPGGLPMWTDVETGERRVGGPDGEIVEEG